MSFYTALTGLNAASKELSVTANNIANSSTTGFKKILGELWRYFCELANSK
jgi:flagellar hook protein FlgE